MVVFGGGQDEEDAMWKQKEPLSCQGGKITKSHKTLTKNKRAFCPPFYLGCRIIIKRPRSEQSADTYFGMIQAHADIRINNGIIISPTPLESIFK